MCADGNNMATTLAATAVMRLILDTVRQHATVDNAVAALERYAAGKDGVPGTADDRLSKETLAMLGGLLGSGMAREIASLGARHIQPSMETKKGWCCVGASATH